MRKDCTASDEELPAGHDEEIPQLPESKKLSPRRLVTMTVTFSQNAIHLALFSVRSGHSIASPFFCVEYVGQNRNDTEIAIPKEGGMRHGNAITKSDHHPPSVKRYQILNDLWLLTHLLDLQIACRTMVD